MNERKKLADILRLNTERENLEKAWDKTEAAGDFAATTVGRVHLPRPVRRTVQRQEGHSRLQTHPEVTKGDHEGRRVWHDLWLTPTALPMSKRDLAKLGVKHLDQLEQPLPQGILVKLKLSLRKDDDGNDYNCVRSFEVIGVEPGDAFEPAEVKPAPDAGPGTAAVDVSFDPEQLEPEADSAARSPCHRPAGRGARPPSKPTASSKGRCLDELSPAIRVSCPGEYRSAAEAGRCFRRPRRLRFLRCESRSGPRRLPVGLLLR